MTPQPRPCSNTRCKRLVFDAQQIKQQRGAVPVAVVLDAAPVSWQDGGRYLPIPAGQPTVTVTKLSATQIHKAFGRDVRLYVLHQEVCEAEQRKAKAKKTDGHA